VTFDTSGDERITEHRPQKEEKKNQKNRSTKSKMVLEGANPRSSEKRHERGQHHKRKKGPMGKVTPGKTYLSFLKGRLNEGGEGVLD